MATTTNYGWTTPDDTALVKDGAAAIRSLGTAIDTSMNTALGTRKSGLVLLNTTTFSGVSSQSFNDVFSSNYNNYRIMFNCNSANTASFDTYFRLRVSGSDNSSANYQYAGTRGGWVGGVTAFAAVQNGSNLQTNFYFMAMSSNETGTVIDLYNPFNTQKTQYSGINYYFDSNTNYAQWTSSGGMTVTTSYTGFTVFSAGATFGGVMSIYGYNK